MRLVRANGGQGSFVVRLKISTRAIVIANSRQPWALCVFTP